ncbi:hypothetical protein DA2_3124 [Desulfovibrio sp. A2]|nr:hypothetical protein DA2_3124 [Desulfovibrio sp. A2]
MGPTGGNVAAPARPTADGNRHPSARVPSPVLAGPRRAPPGGTWAPRITRNLNHRIFA